MKHGKASLYPCRSIWEAKATPTPDSDYLGNFDFDTFQPWSENMCYSTMMEYSPVVILMDDAKYAQPLSSSHRTMVQG
ncbi:hypothetical protein PINS_up018598 [Pythium insidiosum]|nr:hypothetical protein PINS_up018598 [Pythium insidiosum]